MDIIKKREAELEMRKAKKKFYDSQFTLSVDRKEDGDGVIKLSTSVKNNKVRLLDEGFVVDAYGEPLFYLAKGSCQNFYNNLSDDFVGHYDLGHIAFAQNPILLGSWTKSDLMLVDTENGRQALDVDVHLNDDLNIVQDLKKMDFDLAVSVEMECKYNEDMSDEIGYEVYDNIMITGIGIVGDPGNVNSTGLKLNVTKGNNDMDGTIKEPEVIEPVEPDVTEPTEHIEPQEPTEHIEPQEPKEPIEPDVTEPTEEDEPTSDETMSEVLSVLKTLTGQVKSLKEEVSSLKEENTSLKETLSVKEEQEKNFLETIKMSVGELAPQPKKDTKKEFTPSYTDGLC